MDTVEYDDLFVYLSPLTAKNDPNRKMELFVCFTKDYKGRDIKMDCLFFHMMATRWSMIDYNTEMSILFIDEKQDCLIVQDKGVERHITNIKHSRSVHTDRMFSKSTLLGHFRDTLKEELYFNRKNVASISRKGADFLIHSVEPKKFLKMGMLRHVKLDTIEAEPNKYINNFECSDVVKKGLVMVVTTRK
jgi:hypothetical protein